MPTLERLSAGWPALQPVPHDRALLADANGAPDGPEPPRQQRRRDHGAGDRLSGQHRCASEQRRAARRDPAAERLQHRGVRQVPRDGAVGGLGSGPFDRWPTRSGFDKFYGFIGGETNQWAPAIYDGVVRVEHEPDPNYHFTTDMTNQAIAWARFQHAMTPDKPVYMYFATGATHAPHHAPAEYRQALPRQVRRGLGQAARGDAGAADQARRRAGRDEADREAEGDPGVGRPVRGPEETLCAADGSLRGICRAHRLRGRPPRAGPRGDGQAEQHAVLLHRGRQRVERGRRPGRHLQRDAGAQRDRQRHLVAAQVDRSVGQSDDVPAFLDRLGARGQHAVPVDKASRLALRRHTKRNGPALAERHQGEGGGPLAVPSRHRRRADGARGGEAAGADDP